MSKYVFGDQYPQYKIIITDNGVVGVLTIPATAGKLDTEEIEVFADVDSLVARVREIYDGLRVRPVVLGDPIVDVRPVLQGIEEVIKHNASGNLVFDGASDPVADEKLPGKPVVMKKRKKRLDTGSKV